MFIKSFSGEYSFLSNFYKSPVIIDGLAYDTVEHYYQSQKFEDKQTQEIIRLSSTPAIAKKLGKKYPLRSDWEEIKQDVMLRGLLIKFSDAPLKQMLISTHPNILIESNYWHDNYWGMCNCSRCKGVEKQDNLGKMLMKIRKELI